jgi:hypothetical protein
MKTNVCVILSAWLGLLCTAALGDDPAGYRTVQPLAGEPFLLRDGFTPFEPKLADGIDKPLPNWGGTGHMILLRDGRLLLAHAHQDRCRTTTSGDGGATWTNPVVADITLPDEYKEAKVHRPAIVEAADGGLWLFFYTLIKYDVPNPEKSINPLWAARSADGGQTWGAPKLICDGYVGMLQGAIVTSKGQIVVPVCRYAAVRRYVALAVASTNNGQTWQKSEVLDVPDPQMSPKYPFPLSPNSSRGGIEPSVSELPDGRLLMIIRTVHDAMFQSHSSDSGLTWTAPQRSPLSCGGPGNIVRLPGGRAVIAYNPANYESEFGKRWGSPIGYDRQTIAILDQDGRDWTITHDFVKQIEKLNRVVHSTITGLPDGTVLITLPGRSTLLRTTEAELMRPGATKP